MTITKFCQREGYSTASFYPWRRKRQDAPASPPPACLPVDLDHDLVDPSGSAALRIELPGGAVVNVPAGTDVDQQRDLIAANVQATSDEVPA